MTTMTITAISVFDKESGTTMVVALSLIRPTRGLIHHFTVPLGAAPELCSLHDHGSCRRGKECKRIHCDRGLVKVQRCSVT